jgi:predicted XRE-type DNA-binding protein
MEEVVKNIKTKLRMKGQKQKYLCDVLNLDKCQVSNRMNGRVKFQDFELEILSNNDLL